MYGIRFALADVNLKPEISVFWDENISLKIRNLHYKLQNVAWSRIPEPIPTVIIKRDPSDQQIIKFLNPI